MKKIIIVQKIFPAYRKPIFDAIHEKVAFSLLHSHNRSGIKQTSAPYSVLIQKLQYGRGDTHLFLPVFGYLRKHRPAVVIHELAVGIASLPLLLLTRRWFGYKLILWGHMYNRKAGFDPSKSLSDKYRLWLQKKADAIITYSGTEKEELVQQGILADKIFPAPNTLDTNKYLPVRNEFSRLGKKAVKQALGFSHQYNLIFIGRLYEDKWPHYAIEALDTLLKKNALSVALHFVGTGAMEPLLRDYALRQGIQENVFFHGEIYEEYKTGELLYASDIMIMPGCVGLSVNHAFCFDCPVLTFETADHVPAHGPEIEYIVQNKTGFVVKNRSVEEMAAVLIRYLKDEALQKDMQQNIRHLIEQTCPIEKLTGGFIEAIRYVHENQL